MIKINKCESCNNVYSHRQSLWRHKQNCNNKRIRAVEQPIKKPRHLKRENTCSVPYEPETVIGTDVKQQYVGSGEVHNQQHSKTLNPKISALTDTDDYDDTDDLPPPPKQDADLTAMNVDDDNKTEEDENDSDNNESYSRIEPVVDMVVDDQDEDDEISNPVTDPEELLANKIKDTTEYLIRHDNEKINNCLLYTSPSPRDRTRSRMPSSA